MTKGLLIVLVGLVLITLGCGATLSTYRQGWNVANAGAEKLEAEIARGHQADLDAAASSAEVDRVAARWASVYTAYRLFRALLVSTRTAISAAELQDNPDLQKLEELVLQALEAKQAVQGALQ